MVWTGFLELAMMNSKQQQTELVTALLFGCASSKKRNFSLDDARKARSPHVLSAKIRIDRQTDVILICRVPLEAKVLCSDWTMLRTLTLWSNESSKGTEIASIRKIKYPCPQETQTQKGRTHSMPFPPLHHLINSFYLDIISISL